MDWERAEGVLRWVISGTFAIGTIAAFLVAARTRQIILFILDRVVFKNANRAERLAEDRQDRLEKSLFRASIVTAVVAGLGFFLSLLENVASNNVDDSFNQRITKLEKGGVPVQTVQNIPHVTIFQLNQLANGFVGSNGVVLFTTNQRQNGLSSGIALALSRAGVAVYPGVIGSFSIAGFSITQQIVITDRSANRRISAAFDRAGIPYQTSDFPIGPVSLTAAHPEASVIFVSDDGTP